MATLEECLDVIVPVARQMFAGDSGGHGFAHAERTMNIALYLQEREGGDRLVIALGALLHDIHRIMQNESGCFVDPADSLPLVRQVLSKVDLEPEQVEGICSCVKHHELYNWNGDNVSDLNALIVQDADNLDGLGAMGIARMFFYGGSKGLEMFDPGTPLVERLDYSEFEGECASTIHAFYSKSFQLGKYMNTDTARQIAVERTQYMRSFVDRFLSEWNAEY